MLQQLCAYACYTVDQPTHLHKSHEMDYLQVTNEFFADKNKKKKITVLYNYFLLNHTNVLPARQ